MDDIAKKPPRNQNALSHGLFARDVLLPWDCAQDFEKLYADLKSEFLPQGIAETECVLDLARALWQKRTLWRMQPLAVLRDPFAQDILQTERKTWSGIRKSLRAAAKSERTLLGALETECAKIAEEDQAIPQRNGGYLRPTRGRGHSRQNECFAVRRE